VTKLSTVLDQVDNQTMLLPEFQRGYVWNRDQVRGLMRSVYREYPVGALLVWETEAVPDNTRGTGPLAVGGGPKQLLLDGQQRVTTLYGVMRGRAPGFFEGDENAFTGLHFNVESESFEFYAPVKMKDDPRWVDLTRFFVEGMDTAISRIATSGHAGQLPTYLRRLGRLDNIRNREFHVETITGEDKTVDVVVDIFNRVNSGGTKLSKGDLALARICAEWDQARPWMKHHRERWTEQGYSFTLDWLLRNINGVATGKAPFSALENVSAADFEKSLHSAVQYVDHLLYLCSSRLGLDHDRVLLGRYALPVLTRVLRHRPDGRFRDKTEADRALGWYIHAALRGRFAGSTETVLAKDFETADKHGVDGLLSSLTRWRGGPLQIEPSDFEATGRGSRFYPLLYLLTRAVAGRDLLTDEPFLANTGSLQLQEIFPKTALNKAGYSRSEVNSVANFAFVTHETGQRLGRRLPEDYLPECHSEGRHHQWIPDDPGLWSVERYRDFLAARQQLLADAANDFLGRLIEGEVPWEDLPDVPPPEETEPRSPRDVMIQSLMEEFAAAGYAPPAVDCEIADPDTGNVLAVAELFWVDGLQVGQGSPVVLELDPEEADLARLAELGCEVFTSADALRNHALRRSDVASGDREDDGRSIGTSEVAIGVEPELDDEPQAGSGIAAEFDTAVLGLVDRCVAELRYNPKYFRVMVSQHGAIGAAQRLLRAPAVSDGFVKLWENDRLDLTVEALVVLPRFAELFTDDERRTAQRRLEDFGYGTASA
jgi:hypothetical protein